MEPTVACGEESARGERPIGLPPRRSPGDKRFHGKNSKRNTNEKKETTEKNDARIRFLFFFAVLYGYFLFLYRPFYGLFLRTFFSTSDFPFFFHPCTMETSLIVRIGWRRLKKKRNQKKPRSTKKSDEKNDIRRKKKTRPTKNA